MPQEYGSHYNTDYVKLDKLEIYAKTPISFSAVPYSIKELLDKKHDFELVKDGKTYLNIDCEMSGVGSCACGPDLDRKYQAKKASKMSFRIIVK